MALRKIVFTLAILPAVTFAGAQPFDGNYSVSVGTGLLKDLFVLSVAGGNGTLTYAKVFEKPEQPMTLTIRQDAKQMAVKVDKYGNDMRMVLKKSEKGLTCISGCAEPTVHWQKVPIANVQETRPVEKVDFDALPTVSIGDIDGAWIESKRDPESDADFAFEIKGEFVKYYEYLFGLYSKSSTPSVYMLNGSSFIIPRSGGKFLELRRLSETKLVARYPKWEGLVYLYRADSIKFADLKKARDAAEAGG